MTGLLAVFILKIMRSQITSVVLLAALGTAVSSQLTLAALEVPSAAGMS